LGNHLLGYGRIEVCAVKAHRNKIHVGHRMSADTDKSILGNVRDKIMYKIHTATYDPEAEKFAKEEKEKEEKVKEEKGKQEAFEEAQQSQKTQQSQQESTPTESSKTPQGSAKPGIGSQIWRGITLAFVPLLCLMLSSLVANEMIVYTPPVRILFFLFTFLTCFFLRHVMYLLFFAYVIKGGYSYYINQMSGGPKQIIWPIRFSLLPITTYVPESSLGRFFLYPFRYPKKEEETETLSAIMADYQNKLNESYPGLEQVKKLPIFVEDLKNVKSYMENLHQPKYPPPSANSVPEVSAPNVNGNERV
jgi:hypothetical protein